MKLTQSVLFLRFRSLFGIKVPDCDGIAGRHQTDKEIFIRAGTEPSLLSLQSRPVKSKFKNDLDAEP